MKFNIFFILGLLWVAVFTGMMITSVGNDFSAGTYDWTLPFCGLLFSGIPLVLGYIGGLLDKEE